MTDKRKRYIDVDTLEALAEHGLQRIAIAIGVFDGVHKGHQLLIRELVKMAKENDAVPVAFTFNPHPRAVLHPDAAPPLLMPHSKKVELLHKYGVKAVVSMAFSKKLASLTPEMFIKTCLLSPKLKLCGICVGKNWKFGAGGKGGTELLEKFADEGHFKFKSVRELVIDNQLVSSTSVRKAVSAGLLDEAEKMLGRPYSLTGEVEAGNKLAASELSCPTANIKVLHGAMPPNGVYAGFTICGGKRFKSAVAIGLSPTFGPINRHPRIESHIFDFSEDIYGRDIEIELIKYLREERCFSSVEHLKQQIEKDLREIKKILEDKKYE